MAETYRMETQDFSFMSWVRAGESLTDEQCDSLIALARGYEPMPALVANGTLRINARAATIHRIQKDRNSQPVHDMLNELLHRINDRHFRFKLSGIRPPDVIEYVPDKGHFDWHCDFAYHDAAHVRKLTLIAQLSPPDAYDGGDLEVFDAGPKALPKDRGAILAFPSFMQHRVLPVMRGVRHSLVIFGLGPLFR
jgi:PKHD-type hydroxylase